MLKKEKIAEEKIIWQEFIPCLCPKDLEMSVFCKCYISGHLTISPESWHSMLLLVTPTCRLPDIEKIAREKDLASFWSLYCKVIFSFLLELSIFLFCRKYDMEKRLFSILTKYTNSCSKTQFGFDTMWNKSKTHFFERCLFSIAL